jgi:hypothetical protein
MAATLPGVLRAGLPDGVNESPLIYLTPIQSNGNESKCQSEIWFVRDQDDLYVVTAATAWRAQAVRKGLIDARIWVGDVGPASADARYKTLPQIETRAFHIVDSDTHARILEIFGGKYPGEWGTYGPRFKNGLADGSRVMLRYRVS